MCVCVVSLVVNVYRWLVCCRFQYILNAATSPATKMNEETLTYLNQGKQQMVVKYGKRWKIDKLYT